jgi:hypothetical protein
MKTKPLSLALTLCALTSFATANSTQEPSGPIISHIPRQSVASSVIASIGYSKRRHILEIEFANGAVYRYLDVPPSVHRDLMSTSSRARYYDTNIKGNYRVVRVRSRARS